MTIAYACVLLIGLLPYVAAGIAKNGFEGYDNAMPRQWLSKQTGFRARANVAQANLFEALPLFFAAVIIASVANAPQDRIDLLAMGFVLARVAYLICYVANLADYSIDRLVVWNYLRSQFIFPDLNCNTLDHSSWPFFKTQLLENSRQITSYAN